MRHAALAVAIGIAAILVGGCSFFGPSDGPAPIPTEAEAREYFATIVGLASRGDFEGLCAAGSGTCQQQLRDAGRDSVPPLPPRIVGTRVVEPKAVGDGWTSGGFILQVCGIDGRGAPYFDEVLVFRDGARFISVGTVYWSGTMIADQSPTDAGPLPTPAACPA